eukprot:COSAG05_NODE_28_length_29121_cov_56.951933_1_plen_179_part_00
MSALERRLGRLSAQLRSEEMEGRPYSGIRGGGAAAVAVGSGPVLGSDGLLITATVPVLTAPPWAVLERQLISQMEQAVFPYLEKYTHPDGRLVYEPGLRGSPDLELDPHGRITSSRDGLDDFYESFYNWPLLYLLGGGDHLLELGQRQFDATTRLGEELGHIHKEVRSHNCPSSRHCS